jgi:hypothetical protein
VCVPVSPVRRRFIEWSNSRRTVLWFLAICLAGCVIGVYIAYTNAVTLRDHGVRTQAVVTEVHGGRDASVTLQFTTRDGRAITADVGNYDWSPHPRVGDTPTIVYDPRDPRGLVADARLGPDFLAAWFLAAGSVLAAVAFILTYTGKIDWMRMARNRYGIE